MAAKAIWVWTLKDGAKPLNQTAETQEEAKTKATPHFSAIKISVGELDVRIVTAGRGAYFIYPLADYKLYRELHKAPDDFPPIGGIPGL
ncbi:MAG: hypothetical protein HIU89_18090 [Proteobacteria bacterium]|nr:hypothetical protein [Pseudomonadota bacterium]